MKHLKSVSRTSPVESCVTVQGWVRGDSEEL